MGGPTAHKPPTINAEELKQFPREEILEKQKEFLRRIIPFGLYKTIDDVLKDEFCAATGPKKEKQPPKHVLRLLKTEEMLLEKASLKEIAKENDVKIQTVVNHIERLYKKDKPVDIEHLLPPNEDLEKIKAAFLKKGTEFLKPVYEFLGEKYSYETLRLARLCVTSKNYLRN